MDKNTKIDEGDYDMVKKHIFFAAAFFLILTSLLFAQKSSTVNWFGYVRTDYALTINENDDDYNRFNLLFAILGCKADINEYSSLFFLAYFDYPSAYDFDSMEVKSREVAGILDAQIWFMPIENLKLVAGQFVTPFATENLQSAAKTDFINRGYIVANSPSYRDVGAYLDYNTKLFRLYAGAVNGSGMNVIDNNNYKNILLRSEAFPITGLKLACATSIGKDDQENDEAESENYYSANISYKTKGLYITTEGSYKDYMDTETTTLYAYTQYDIPIGKKLLHNVIPAFRYDFLDPPGDNDRQDRYTFGLGLSFDKNKWLSLFRINYEFVTSESDTDPPDNLIVELQMRFE